MESTTTPKEHTVIDLIKVNADEYRSTDGRIEFHHDHTFETSCDEPHPMKVRLDHLDRWYTDGGAEFINSIKRRGGRVVNRRTREGVVAYLTWYCDGGEDHWYSMWTVSSDGDWTDDVYDTFTQARGAVEQLSGQRTRLLRQPRATETTEPERTFNGAGVAHWATCGHFADYDINMDCGTCHQPVRS